jgi:hypothetical protein
MVSAYDLTEDSYLTILLHAAKYPSCTVCGVLLGKVSGKACTVTAAVPLFHLSMLLAPCVETALAQVCGVLTTTPCSRTTTAADTTAVVSLH